MFLRFPFSVFGKYGRGDISWYDIRLLFTILRHGKRKLVFSFIQMNQILILGRVSFEKIWTCVMRLCNSVAKGSSIGISNKVLNDIHAFEWGRRNPFLAVVCNLIVWMQKWFCLSQLLFPSQEQLAIVIKMLKQNQNTRNLPKTFPSKDALHQTIETLLKNTQILESS